MGNEPGDDVPGVGVPGATVPGATARPGFHQPARADLELDALTIAPTLLGGILRVQIDGASVAVRITEVEAYHGRGTGPVPDPGSHARMGKTARNATMWGEPGHLYVYLSHGIHSCVNVACSPDGIASGVLLRAGEVIEGVDAATARRTTSRAPRDLARGPGRLGTALGLVSARHNGIDALAGGAPRDGAVARLWVRDEPLREFASGPRVGVAGRAGTSAFPWRFWIPDDPTVSPFRPGRGAIEESTE